MNKELIREVLELRLQLAKTPPKKYYTLRRLAAVDGRAHGTLLFHGAQPGRWAGRILNPQNMPRPAFEDTDNCVELYPHRDLDLVRCVYDNPMEALSSTIRSMIKAKPGHRLMVGDFSAIEARLVAWQAGQDDVLDVFRGHGKIYEHEAAKIYHVNASSIQKGSTERQVGKVAVLACGFEGGWRAFVAMGKNYGLDIEDIATRATPTQRIEMANIKEWWASLEGEEDEERETEPEPMTDGQAFADLIKREWRESNGFIVAYWRKILEAAIYATEHPGTTVTVNKVAYRVIKNTLFCRLPSGRKIAYHHPRKGRNRWGRDILLFVGTDDRGNWTPQATFGGRLVQNITEAIGRDLLAEAMTRLESAGYPVVMHVHDEVVSEVPDGFGSLEEFDRLLSEVPDWAEGLPIGSESFEAMRYRK